MPPEMVLLFILVALVIILLLLFFVAVVVWEYVQTKKLQQFANWAVAVSEWLKNHGALGGHPDGDAPPDGGSVPGFP